MDGFPADITVDADMAAAVAMGGEAAWTDAGLVSEQELQLHELEVLEWLPDAAEVCDEVGMDVVGVGEQERGVDMAWS